MPEGSNICISAVNVFNDKELINENLDDGYIYITEEFRGGYPDTFPPVLVFDRIVRPLSDMLGFVEDYITASKEGYYDSEPLIINSTFYEEALDPSQECYLTHTFYLTPLDQTPPTTPEITYPEDGAELETIDEIEWTDAEDDASLFYILTINDEEFATNDTSYAPDLDAGSHKAKVRAEDEFGNEGDDSEEISFKIKSASSPGSSGSPVGTGNPFDLTLPSTNKSNETNAPPSLDNKSSGEGIKNTTPVLKDAPKNESKEVSGETYTKNEESLDLLFPVAIIVAIAVLGVVFLLRRRTV